MNIKDQGCSVRQTSFLLTFHTKKDKSENVLKKFFNYVEGAGSTEIFLSADFSIQLLFTDLSKTLKFYFHIPTVSLLFFGRKQFARGAVKKQWRKKYKFVPTLQTQYLLLQTQKSLRVQIRGLWVELI